MQPTNGKFFSDSNVLLYLLDKDEFKKAKAEEILFNNPVISTQVINENINVAYKEFHLPKQKIIEHIEMLLIKCDVMVLSIDTIRLAYRIFTRYQYRYYDCLILASALESDCTILYSEDMQHNQMIAQKLHIINPFLK
ncbi:MAG: VapC toxin family PIN domain ribonuclease [Bacteroidetes bacterium CG_4_10_14_3_um_filter_31_20]|nr:MAG: VapC toxin family PIN domain ribonuclease [Bacteroidetes bacterium CG_4_8_14_3_um_filter_31_14]PIY02662.1 MAG: VapC toxin family PIN domain ribonuclease [Bacteroidetes bacterium CG_4_10_14_3_um_filter_31_20]